MSKFAQALAYLLPQGFAWPRDLNSVWMRLLTGVAAGLDELDQFTTGTTVEWLPHATHTRLEEWEAATQLPDPCFGPEQDYEARRGRVLARLRGPTGAYPDSSPAAPGALEAICLSFGVQAAVVRYNTPFRVGAHRVGRALGTLDGTLYVLLTVVSKPFRVGVSHVGDRLVERPPEAEQLACALQAYVPSRFEIVIVFQ